MNTGRQGIKSRSFQGDNDFWLVRELLIETYPITSPGFNWENRRWEGSRFYRSSGAWQQEWQGKVRLWETEDDHLVAVVHPEGYGDAHLQVHPGYRYLETDMVAWAEEHLSALTQQGNRRQLDIFVYEYDDARQHLLESRGYQMLSSGGVTRRLHLRKRPSVQPCLAQGYLMRTTQPQYLQDCQRIADLLNAAFDRDFHNAEEYQNFTRQAPSYRNELDLVAVAPDASFAAYVGISYDTVNKLGVIEPVCTHPAHRRKGLAHALIVEGLNRLEAGGALEAVVGTGDSIPANRLYDGIGFTEVAKGYIWRKFF